MITRNTRHDAPCRGFRWRWAGPRFLPAIALATAACIAGCATSGPGLYESEEFTSANTYSHSFPGSGAATCEAARRALLSQGYIVSEAKPAFIKGTKNFQRNKDSHAEIEFSITCAPNSEGSNSTTVFANAVRQMYSLKKSSNSASVGVGVLGSLSVPFGLSDDALVKVGAETIAAQKFYDQFFARVENYLDRPDKDEPAAEEPAPVLPASPLPPSPLPQSPASPLQQSTEPAVPSSTPPPGRLR